MKNWKYDKFATLRVMRIISRSIRCCNLLQESLLRMLKMGMHPDDCDGDDGDGDAGGCGDDGNGDLESECDAATCCKSPLSPH